MALEDRVIEEQDALERYNRESGGIDPYDHDAQLQALQPYMKYAWAREQAEKIQRERQAFLDEQTLRSPGIVDGAADVAGGGAAATPPPVDPNAPPDAGAAIQRADGTVVYPNAGQPPASATDQATRRYSKTELEQIALRDPDEAARIRDEQAALDTAPSVIEPPAEYIARTGTLPPPPMSTPRDQAIAEAQAKQKGVASEWGPRLDIGNYQGDTFRKLPAPQQVGAYHRDRSNLPPEMQAEGDRILAPQIERSITENQAILDNPDLDSNSKDAINARRKLKEAYSLINARNGYKPLAANGVKGGLPIGRNEALTQQVIDNSVNQPSGATTATQNQVKAENAVLSSKPKNRITEAFAAAAWRQFDRGQIDRATYEHLMRTGRWPGGKPDIEAKQFGEHGVFATGTDANGNFVFKKLIEGSSDRKGRNVLGKDGSDAVEIMAKELAERLPGKQDWKKYDREFKNVLAIHEREAMNRGYDYSNPLDLANIFTRFSELHRLADAAGRQFWFRGHFYPTFEEAYDKTILEALFTEIPQEDQEETGVTVSPVKGYLPGLGAALLEEFGHLPEFQGLSEEEAVAKYSEITQGG
jgi:hypothetical protein